MMKRDQTAAKFKCCIVRPFDHPIYYAIKKLDMSISWYILVPKTNRSHSFGVSTEFPSFLRLPSPFSSYWLFSRRHPSFCAFLLHYPFLCLSLNVVISIPEWSTTIYRFFCGLYAFPVPEHQNENQQIYNIGFYDIICLSYTVDNVIFTQTISP